MVDAALAHSEDEAVAVLRRFSTAVAVKAEAPGLLHKSDLGCVRLDCTDEQEVRDAYAAVVRNARNAGFEGGALIQPMIKGVAEAYAGIIDDPLFGPAICFGLGGVFVEILHDTVTEMAPLTHDGALEMIHRIKGAPLLRRRARPRPRGRGGARGLCWSPLDNSRLRTADGSGRSTSIPSSSARLAWSPSISPSSPSWRTRADVIANAAE